MVVLSKQNPQFSSEDQETDSVISQEDSQAKLNKNGLDNIDSEEDQIITQHNNDKLSQIQIQNQQNQGENSSNPAAGQSKLFSNLLNYFQSSKNNQAEQNQKPDKIQNLQQQGEQNIREEIKKEESNLLLNNPLLDQISQPKAYKSVLQFKRGALPQINHLNDIPGIDQLSNIGKVITESGATAKKHTLLLQKIFRNQDGEIEKVLLIADERQIRNFQKRKKKSDQVMKREKQSKGMKRKAFQYLKQARIKQQKINQNKPNSLKSKQPKQQQHLQTIDEQGTEIDKLSKSFHKQYTDRKTKKDLQKAAKGLRQKKQEYHPSAITLGLSGFNPAILTSPTVFQFFKNTKRPGGPRSSTSKYSINSKGQKIPSSSNWQQKNSTIEIKMSQDEIEQQLKLQQKQSKNTTGKNLVQVNLDNISLIQKQPKNIVNFSIDQIGHQLLQQKTEFKQPISKQPSKHTKRPGKSVGRPARGQNEDKFIDTIDPYAKVSKLSRKRKGGVENQFNEKLQDIVDQCVLFDKSRLFHQEVRTKDVPDYYSKVKEGIALSTLRGKCKRCQYGRIEEFKDDLIKIVQNSVEYNGEQHFVTEMARNVVKYAFQQIKKDEILLDAKSKAILALKNAKASES